MNTSSHPNLETLTAQLMEQLQGAPLASMAEQLGIGTEQAHSAATLAVPLLLGAMGRNAQDGEGARSLLGALQRDHMPAAAAGAGPHWGGLLGSLLGGLGAAGSAGRGAGGDGAAILGHILGGRRGRAEQQLGEATGLGANAGRLLQLLAPVVMAFLAQRVRAGNLGAGDLGQVLASGSPAGAPGGIGGLLAQVLDQDGNGRLDLGDLLRVGGSLLGGRR